MASALSLEHAVIHWALETARTSCPFPWAVEQLEAWDCGESMPSYQDVKKISSLTGIRETDFFRKTPPPSDCELIHVRTCPDTAGESPSRNLLDTHEYHMAIHQWCQGHMRSSFEPDALPDLEKDSPDQAAERIRAWFGFPEDFVTDWKDPVFAFGRARRLISLKGIQVFLHEGICHDYPFSLELSECRSCSIHDPSFPFLFVNTSDLIRGQLYALLFSLVQLLTGRTRLFNDPLSRSELLDPHDRFCRDVTECLLMPTHLFADSWKSSGRSFRDKLSDLEQRYMLTPYAFVRRASALGFLPSKDLPSVMNQVVSQWSPSQENSNVRADIWRLLASFRWDWHFFSALGQSVRDGITSDTQAQSLTRTSAHEFEVSLDKASRILAFDPDRPSTQKHGSTLEILGPICIISKDPDERKNRV